MNKNVGTSAQDLRSCAQRRCFREPIQEIFDVARLLDQAVTAHLAGDHRDAARLIAEADIQAVRDWTDSIWAKEDPNIHRRRPEGKAFPRVCKCKRDLDNKPSNKQKQALVNRDGYHCLFCGIPLIRAEIRDAIRKHYRNELKWGRRKLSQHAGFQCLLMQFDHVIPHSRGGPTDLDNLIVTCNACNYGRSDSMLEEVELIDPRGRCGAKATWDGYATWDGLKRFRSCYAAAGSRIYRNSIECGLSKFA